MWPAEDAQYRSSGRVQNQSVARSVVLPKPICRCWKEDRELLRHAVFGVSWCDRQSERLRLIDRCQSATQDHLEACHFSPARCNTRVYLRLLPHHERLLPSRALVALVAQFSEPLPLQITLLAS